MNQIAPQDEFSKIAPCFSAWMADLMSSNQLLKGSCVCRDLHPPSSSCWGCKACGATPARSMPARNLCYGRATCWSTGKLTADNTRSKFMACCFHPCRLGNSGLCCRVASVFRASMCLPVSRIMGKFWCSAEFVDTLAGRSFAFSLLVHCDESSPMVDFLDSSSVLQVCETRFGIATGKARTAGCGNH